MNARRNALVKRSVHELPSEMGSTLPETPSQGGWEAWGRHGHALEAEQYQAGRTHVRARVEDMTAVRSQAA
jgi:hypothetical protein